jgi:hypothetical protein
MRGELYWTNNVHRRLRRAACSAVTTWAMDNLRTSPFSWVPERWSTPAAVVTAILGIRRMPAGLGSIRADGRLARPLVRRDRITAVHSRPRMAASSGLHFSLVSAAESWRCKSGGPARGRHEL